MRLARKTFNYVCFAALLVLSVACDEGTKTWARRALPGRGGVSVIDGVWDFHYAENSGGAFSLLQGLPGGRFILISVGIAILFALFLFVRRQAGGRAPGCVALGLLAGGAIGNLYDRVVYGRVTDFVHWHWRGHEWPVFNGADALLVAGGVLLMLTWKRPAPV